jgi:hypothetical protein
MDETDALLSERETTHGSFADNARIAQGLKELFRSCPGWERMSKVQRESFDMIACKMSRCLSGKVDEVDHLRDIAGYAELAAKDIAARER